MRYDYLIIGNGIAGVTAAETIREKDPTSSIAIVFDEQYPLYSRVLLPSYLKHKIRREQVFLRSANHFIVKNIDLRPQMEVIYIDIKQQEVGLRNRETIGFKKLLIASGGRPRPIPEDFRGEFSYRLQTLDDADRLYKDIRQIRKPLVVGSSLIGLELMEAFTENGAPPYVLVRGTHFFHEYMDPAGAELLHINFRNKGIDPQYGETINSVARKEAGGLSVMTSAFRELTCDAIAFGIGIDRNIEFLQGSGIETGDKGIKTNEFLETNVPGIYAAGDVADFYDVIAGKNHVAGTWSSAFLQGYTAGLNMAGAREMFKRVSSYSIRNFGFHITILGECGKEGDEAVARLDKLHHRYERFFLKDGVLKGAVLVNCFEDKAHLARLIETKTPVGEHAELLREFSFDVHSIAVVE